jgi:pimeloyl-ACP methyl ester carboxylesterase
MTRRKFMWLAAASGLALGGGAVHLAYRASLGQAIGRLEGRSQVFQSRFGTTEYATAGEGPQLLMIHGTGGGFDQGLSFTTPLVKAGWRIIAPSRFGYLRTDFPADPSLDNQADALAALLDHLEIERLPVMGGSAGALSALQFAIRHPARCSAVIAIVPAAFVPGRAPVRPGKFGAAIMEYGLQSDFLFWAGTKLVEDKMITTLLATDPAIVHGASLQEQARARGILRDILPVSARAKGLLNDGIQAGTPPEQEIGNIKVPTLAISVEDDRFGTADAARHIAATVPGAELVIYPSGGHVWVGHDAEMWLSVDTFLRKL